MRIILKSNILKSLCLLLILFTFEQVGLAQVSDFKVIRVGNMKTSTNKGVKYAIFKRAKNSQNIFKKGNVKLYCDLAVQNTKTNDFRAFGDVKIKDKQGTLYGDTLFFYRSKDLAEVRGNVRLVQEDATLKTDLLYYNMNTGIAYYLTGGKMVQENTVLTSVRGYLDQNNEIFSFAEKVHMLDTKKNQTLDCDTLWFSDDVAHFPGATRITQEGGSLDTESGEYNTKTGVFTFKGRTEIDNEDYNLKAYHINKGDIGKTIAKGDVELYTKKDSVSIFGENMIYSEDSKYSEVYGEPMMQRPFGADTLFLIADTLISVNDSINDIQRLYAYHNVKIVMQQMQGSCDSLVYDMNDSLMYFYSNPVMWQNKTQITADTIIAKLTGSTIDKMYLHKKAFVITKDTLGNYNQIKGREMIATFKGQQMDNIKVDGNAQTLYFALSDDEVTKAKLLMGMNKVDCGYMTLYFNEENDLSNIHFVTQPESKFIPWQDLLEPDKRLPKFKVREDRPNQALAYERVRGAKKVTKETETEAEEEINKGEALIPIPEE